MGKYKIFSIQLYIIFSCFRIRVRRFWNLFGLWCLFLYLTYFKSTSLVILHNSSWKVFFSSLWRVIYCQNGSRKRPLGFFKSSNIPLKAFLPISFYKTLPYCISNTLNSHFHQTNSQLDKRINIFTLIKRKIELMIGYVQKKIIKQTNVQLRNPADFLDFLSMKLVKSNNVFYSKNSDTVKQW